MSIQSKCDKDGHMVQSCGMVPGMGVKGWHQPAKKASSEQGRQDVLYLFNPKFCFSRLKMVSVASHKQMGIYDYKRNKNELISYLNWE